MHSSGLFTPRQPLSHRGHAATLITILHVGKLKPRVIQAMVGHVFPLMPQLCFFHLFCPCRICLRKGTLVLRSPGLVVPQRPMVWVALGASEKGSSPGPALSS